MPLIQSSDLILGCLAAFLCGSIPFGLLLVKLAGKGDVRQHGSGNIGATNVSRVGGRGLGVITLLLDIAKGFLPVFLARRADLPADMLAALALCATAGHIFTPWLRFKGGKGVATALGAALAFRAVAVLPSLGIFILLVAAFRYVSLGSIAGALMLPVSMGWPHESVHGAEVLGLRLQVSLREQDPWQATFLWVLIAVLVVAKHHENITRLLRGTESPLWGGKGGGSRG